MLVPATRTQILQFCEDPADPFRLRMPEEFANAKSAIESLVKLKERMGLWGRSGKSRQELGCIKRGFPLELGDTA